MFALITTPQNWSVLLRDFEYLKYAGKMIKSPSQQGGGMGSSTQKREIRLLKKVQTKYGILGKEGKACSQEKMINGLRWPYFFTVPK